MRPTRQSKIITLHLEGLWNLRKQMAILQDDINNVIQQGESWLSGNDEVGTFLQINQFLSSELSKIIQNCSSIADKIEDCPQSDQCTDQNRQDLLTGVNVASYNTGQIMKMANVDEELSKPTNVLQIIDDRFFILLKKYDQLNDFTESLSKEVKILKQKEKDQQKDIESISINQKAIKTKFNSRIDEINTELHTASNFIQSQTKMFSEKMKHNEVKNYGELKNEFENIKSEFEDHKINIGMKHEENRKMLMANVSELKNTLANIQSEFVDHKENISKKCEENEKMYIVLTSELKNALAITQSELDGHKENICKKHEELEKSLVACFDEIKTHTDIIGDSKSKIYNLSMKVDEIENNEKNNISVIETVKNERKHTASALLFHQYEIDDHTIALQNLQDDIEDIYEMISEQDNTSNAGEIPVHIWRQWDNEKNDRHDTEGSLVDDGCNKQFPDDHETQMSQDCGDPDLLTEFNNCQKNPGHPDLIPIEEFNINHLPFDFRHQDLFELIKAAADLTVRIDVDITSLQRPKFWPNTDVSYPFYDLRRKTKLRIGSGMVTGVLSKFTDGVDEDSNKHLRNLTTCWCSQCRFSDTASQVWWEFNVATAAQVVFSNIEAFCTSIKLFYDNEDSPCLSVDQVIINEVDIENDWCLLRCVTCDKNLPEKLNLLMKQFKDIVNVCKRYNETDVGKLNFIVSHPHGYFKRVIIGKWVDRVKTDDQYSQFTYTTCTCPGSSGAAVFCVGIDGEPPAHSGSLISGLGCSGGGY